MLDRLDIREGQTPEAARKRFDGQLGVSAWATPGRERRAPEPVEQGAPWWWHGAEEASDSFFRSMGVVL
jgi:hypothetical protein